MYFFLMIVLFKRSFS